MAIYQQLTRSSVLQSLHRNSALGPFAAMNTKLFVPWLLLLFLLLLGAHKLMAPYRAEDTQASHQLQAN